MKILVANTQVATPPPWPAAPSPSPRTYIWPWDFILHEVTIMIFDQFQVIMFWTLLIKAFLSEYVAVQEEKKSCTENFPFPGIFAKI